MAERDPAFLYYDADVALDVSHMTRLERGCYLDLIQLYKRYHGYTMVEIRKVLGIDFESCWQAIELVLVLDGDKYHIPWLRNSLEKKAQRSEKQRANVKNRWDKVKNSNSPPHESNTTVIPPYNHGTSGVLPSESVGNTIVIPIIETVTETETKEGIEEKEGGVGEEEEGREGPADWKPPEGPAWPAFPNALQSGIFDIFLAEFPGYPRRDSIDLAACLRLGYQIGELNGWPWDSCLNGRMEKVFTVWKEIVTYIKTDKWFRTKPLAFLAENFQGLIQSKNDTGNDKQSNRNRNAPNLTATGSPVVQTFVGGTSRKPWRD